MLHLDVVVEWGRVEWSRVEWSGVGWSGVGWSVNICRPMLLLFLCHTYLYVVTILISVKPEPLCLHHGTLIGICTCETTWHHWFGIFGGASFEIKRSQHQTDTSHQRYSLTQSHSATVFPKSHTVTSPTGWLHVDGHVARKSF